MNVISGLTIILIIILIVKRYNMIEREQKKTEEDLIAKELKKSEEELIAKEQKKTEEDLIARELKEYEYYSQVLMDIMLDTYDEYIPKLSELLTKYSTPLHIKKNQLLYRDDYGDIVEREWKKEVYMFIEYKLYNFKCELLDEIGKRCESYYPNLEFKNYSSSGSYYDIAKDFVNERLVQMVNYVADLPLESDGFAKEMVSDDPYMFEQQVADVFISKGWDAKVTNGSGDQGADVIAENSAGTKIIVQCKLYSQPVGNKAVQEVYSALNYYQGNLAMVVTNSSYTKSARQLAESNKVILLHYDELKEFLDRAEN